MERDGDDGQSGPRPEPESGPGSESRTSSEDDGRARSDGGNTPASEGHGHAETATNPGVIAHIDPSAAAATQTDVELMRAVNRHDGHKLRDRRHAAAAAAFAGGRVNDPISLGADTDAALLRPRHNDDDGNSDSDDGDDGDGDGTAPHTLPVRAFSRRLPLVTGVAGASTQIPGDTPETFVAVGPREREKDAATESTGGAEA